MKYVRFILRPFAILAGDEMVSPTDAALFILIFTVVLSLVL